MQYVKPLPGIISAEIESDLLQGAKLNLKYSITVHNNSDIDYLHSDYYYYGIQKTDYETSARANLVVDYLDKTMNYDLGENSQWDVKTASDLFKKNNEGKVEIGYVNEEVYKVLAEEDYHILITTEFNDVTRGTSKTLEYNASRTLAISDENREENHVEIIEIAGIRKINSAIPGNYNPSESGPDEPDNDKITMVITPPTGIATNYILYIIAGAMTLIILVAGIVVIKKKVIR